MLQYKAIDPAALGLLKKLMKDSELKDFFLVGGSAMALHLGHRISVDLDLFINNVFDEKKLKSHLSSMYNLSSTTTEENTISTFIRSNNNEVKVEFISYVYKLLKPVKIEQGIRLLEIEDLIPMKLSAISNRGSKKDFYDIYFSLEKYSLSEMLDLFKQKFEIENLFHVIKSLTYFSDAENEPEPFLLKDAKWDEVKSTLVKEANLILK